MEDAPLLFKISKSDCPDTWIRSPRHKWPKSWSSMEDPVAPLKRNLYGHPLAGLLWERQFDKVLLEHGWEKVPNWECSFVYREKGLFLSVYVDEIKLSVKKQNIDPMWKVLMKEVELGEPASFLDHVYLGCTQRECQTSKDIVDNYRNMFEPKNFAGATEKLPYSVKLGANIPHGLWCGRSCEEMCGKMLRIGRQNNSTTIQSRNTMPCIDDHQFREEEMGFLGELSKVCSHGSEMLVFGAHWQTCFFMVREQACSISHQMDQSLWQTLGSFDIRHSSHMRIQTILSCGKYSATMQIRIVSGLWFCWRSRRLKTNIRWTLVRFWKSHVRANKLDVQETDFSFTQFNRSWNCFSWWKLRMDGIPALELLGFGKEVFHSSPNQFNNTKDQVRGNSSRNTTSNEHTQNQTKIPTQHDNFDPRNVDHVSSKAKFSRFGAMLYIFEDNEAVIQMIINGRSPTMRHVSRSHIVAHDWLLDRINLDP